LSRFHYNDGNANAPQHYVIRALFNLSIISVRATFPARPTTLDYVIGSLEDMLN